MYLVGAPRRLRYSHDHPHYRLLKNISPKFRSSTYLYDKSRALYHMTDFAASLKTHVLSVYNQFQEINGLLLVLTLTEVFSNF